MPSELWVELTKCRDGTPAKRKVAGVDMVKAACIWTEIERRACEYAVEKVALQAWIRFEERAEAINVVGV